MRVIKSAVFFLLIVERHARDEEENEKKKSRKPKFTRGPFVSSFTSVTQSALTDDDLIRMRRTNNNHAE